MADKYVIIDGKPAPAKMGPLLLQLKEETGVVYNSMLRTQDAVNYARAKGYTLSSQAELYSGYINGLPGYNPANPPGFSTHELRNDGAAYPTILRGARIPYWAVGLDISDWLVPQFCDAARQHGWVATLTYPGSPSEAHHVNFRKQPILFNSLKRGDRGPRVKKYSARLHFIRPPKQPPYLGHEASSKFGPGLEAAVEKFQIDHHLPKDGIIGPDTAAQINVTFRSQWQKRDKKANAR